MAMSFEESLEAICEAILPSTSDFQSYNEDFNKICKQLIDRMKEYDNLFSRSLDVLSLTENPLPLSADMLPDEFDLYIKLRLPFPITICEDSRYFGSITLTTPIGTLHPLVRDDHISRLYLQDWIRKILLLIIADGLRLPINGRIYLIEYPVHGRGYDVAHTILAKELRYGKRNFSFDLIAAFEFEPNSWLRSTKSITDNLPWFAIPFGKKLPRGSKLHPDEFSFMACAVHWERNALHERKNLRKSLRLMKAIRDVKDLHLITNHMLKCVYIEQIEMRPVEFWEQSIGGLLIHMFEILADALRHQRLPFFIDKRFKNLSSLRMELSKSYPIQLKLIVKKLRHFQRQSRVNYFDIAAFSYALSRGSHESRLHN